MKPSWADWSADQDLLGVLTVRTGHLCLGGSVRGLTLLQLGWRFEPVLEVLPLCAGGDSAGGGESETVEGGDTAGNA